MAGSKTTLLAQEEDRQKDTEKMACNDGIPGLTGGGSGQKRPLSGGTEQTAPL